MPSPFPGMNPYLEQDDVWQDFHDSFIPAVRDALSPQVSPDFIVKIEEHIYIHEPTAEEHIRVVSGDVSVIRATEVQSETAAAAVTAAPARILIPSIEIEKQTYLEVRDRKNRELVTVIELLSPTNKKSGPDREQYLAKRAHLLRSPAHFVEIDLLRGWSRMPGEQAPDCDYCVVVSRAEDRPQAGFWPIQLRERLPVIPVPLRAPRTEVNLELQEVLHSVYDRAYYKDYIYQGTPYPALRPEDSAWAASILSQNAES